jgi:two-component system response regulator YesN
MPQKHVLTADVVALGRQTWDGCGAVDAGAADPGLIRDFLQSGLESEVEDFTADYFGKLGSALDSLMFRHYLMLSVRVSALSVIGELGLDRAQLAQRLPAPEPGAPDELRPYFTEVLRAALSLRDEETQRQGGRLVESALQYIDGHYTDEDISLNAVARAVNISTNYLSAMFSQKMGISFVEYLTQKRMARARQLLRQSGKRSSEIAAEVGYKDPRYFGAVFKKTQGCTPREYRAGDVDR